MTNFSMQQHKDNSSLARLGKRSLLPVRGIYLVDLNVLSPALLFLLVGCTLLESSRMIGTALNNKGAGNGFNMWPQAFR